MINVNQIITESEILLTTKYATAFYNHSRQLMGIEWKGSCTKEEYQQLFEVLLNNARNKPTRLFYSDLRKQGVIAVESRKHFEEYVTPESIKLGLKKTGVVTDSNVFKRYYLNLLIKASNKFGNPIKICSSPEEAMEFLLSN